MNLNVFFFSLQDLVKSHLMNAVRSEVEELKEKIIKSEETISQQQMEISKQHNDFNREVGKLQAENEFLKAKSHQKFSSNCQIFNLNNNSNNSSSSNNNNNTNNFKVEKKLGIFHIFLFC